MPQNSNMQESRRSQSPYTQYQSQVGHSPGNSVHPGGIVVVTATSETTFQPRHNDHPRSPGQKCYGGSNCQTRTHGVGNSERLSEEQRRQGFQPTTQAKPSQAERVCVGGDCKKHRNVISLVRSNVQRTSVQVQQHVQAVCFSGCRSAPNSCVPPTTTIATSTRTTTTMASSQRLHGSRIPSDRPSRVLHSSKVVSSTCHPWARPASQDTNECGGLDTSAKLGIAFGTIDAAVVVAFVFVRRLRGGKESVVGAKPETSVGGTTEENTAAENTNENHLDQKTAGLVHASVSYVSIESRVGSHNSCCRL